MKAPPSHLKRTWHALDCFWKELQPEMHLFCRLLFLQKKVQFFIWLSFFMASLSSSSHSAIWASYNEKNFFNFLHLFYEIFSLFVLYVEKRGSSSPLPRKLWWISSKLFLLFFCSKQENKHLKTLEKNSLYSNFFAFALCHTPRKKVGFSPKEFRKKNPIFQVVMLWFETASSSVGMRKFTFVVAL